MALIPVTEQNFETEVLMSEIPVLLEFGATWCGPCKTTEPELRALSEELQGKLKVVTVDIDHAPGLTQQFGVQSVPAFAVFFQGRPVGAKLGALTRAQLRELVEPVLPRAAGSLKPEEVKQLLAKQQITPVDTRESAAFNRARLPSAINIPLEELESRLAELLSLPAVPVLYCRSGDKTKSVAEKLASEGAPVSYMEGGLLGWEASGFDVERPD
jgi:thioredoxin 1